MLPLGFFLRMMASQKYARIVQHIAEHIATLTMVKEHIELQSLKKWCPLRDPRWAKQQRVHRSVVARQYVQISDAESQKDRSQSTHDLSKSGSYGLYEYTENKEWDPPSPTFVRTQSYFNIVSFHIIVPFHASTRLYPPECYANPNLYNSYIVTINSLSPHFSFVRNIRNNVYKFIGNYKKFQLFSALRFVNMDKLFEISNDLKNKASCYPRNLTNISLDKEKIFS